VPYDVVFLHPPAIYDFREKPLFPGPVAQTLPQATTQFVIFPIGLLSMADYLDRNGYKVKVINLAEEMVFGGLRDVENYLMKLESAAYAIDLHWVVHAQGPLEIAKRCKKHHPNSLTILGGLTATCLDAQGARSDCNPLAYHQTRSQPAYLSRMGVQLCFMWRIGIQLPQTLR